MLKGRMNYYLVIILFVLDCTVPFILGVFYKNYSHTTMLLSVLGNQTSPVHRIYRIWMGILGMGIIWSGIVLFKDFKSISINLSRGLLFIMVCYGLLDCIASCFFEIGESKEMIGIAAKIHGIGSALGSTAFLFGGLLIGKLFLKIGEIGLAKTCFVIFGITIIIFGLFIASDKPELKQSIGCYEGIWQRLSYGFMYLPFIILATYMNIGNQ